MQIERSQDEFGPGSAQAAEQKIRGRNHDERFERPERLRELLQAVVTRVAWGGTNRSASGQRLNRACALASHTQRLVG